MNRVVLAKPDYRKLAALIWTSATVTAVLAALPIDSAIGKAERIGAALACPALAYLGYLMYRGGKSQFPSAYQWAVWAGVLLIFLYGLTKALAKLGL
jgi:hypothetical protein